MPVSIGQHNGLEAIGSSAMVSGLSVSTKIGAKAAFLQAWKVRIFAAKLQGSIR